MNSSKGHSYRKLSNLQPTRNNSEENDNLPIEIDQIQVEAVSSTSIEDKNMEKKKASSKRTKSTGRATSANADLNDSYRVEQPITQKPKRKSSSNHSNLDYLEYLFINEEDVEKRKRIKILLDMKGKVQLQLQLQQQQRQEKMFLELIREGKTEAAEILAKIFNYK